MATRKRELRQGRRLQGGPVPQSHQMSGITETNAQLDRIRQTLESWLSVLFQDGLLEPELVKLKAG